jgi:nucleoside-diphosphate-sugar epimerase
MVGGSKGGVGKSFVTLALVDHLRRTEVNVVLIERDTSNPDVMKAVHDEIECVSCDLDDVDGWIDFVNFCDQHRDATVVVDTAARSQTGVAK